MERDWLTRPDAFADIWPQLVSLGGRLDLALDRLADALDPSGCGRSRPNKGKGRNGIRPNRVSPHTRPGPATRSW
jgi:hypothetical protein